MTSTNGLIVLGNTGAGKSFIGNLILNSEAFEHECSADSVTHKTELREFSEGSTRFSIFNIPGLIEDDQEAVERNKVEIHKAFQIRPNSLVAFVFNVGAGGRIREDDIIAFQAIKKVYSFQSKSLLAIVNDLPSDRKPDYEANAKVKLEKSLGLQDFEVCFLDRINQQQMASRNALRNKLLASINKCMSSLHKREGDIKLRVDELKELRKEWKLKQDQFEQEIKNLQQELSNTQKNCEDLQRRCDAPRVVHYDSNHYMVPVPVIYSSPDVLVPPDHPGFDAFCNRFIQRIYYDKN